MRIFLLAFILVLMAATFSWGNDDIMRVGVDNAYPPFVYVDEKNGELSGFDVDIAKAICRRLNRKCEIKVIPFDEMIPGIVSGKIDLAMAGMAKTPEREALVLFSDKYYRFHNLFIEVAGTVDFTSEGLKDKTITVQSGSTQAAYIKERYGKTAKILILDSFDEMIDALLRKRADVAFVTSLSAYSFLINDKRGLALEIVGDAVEVDNNSASIIVAKSDIELMASVNKALANMRLTGEYDKINHKYLGFSVY